MRTAVNWHNCCDMALFVADSTGAHDYCSGDSSGGNLAAAVCLKLRDMKYTYRPKVQVLIYPILQALDFQLPSYSNRYKVITSPRNIATFTAFYAGNMTMFSN